MATQLTTLGIKSRGGIFLGRRRAYELWEMKHYSNIDWKVLYLRNIDPQIKHRKKRTFWLRAKVHTGEVNGRPNEMIPLRKKPSILKWVRQLAKANSDAPIWEAARRREVVRELQRKRDMAKQRKEIQNRRKANC